MKRYPAKLLLFGEYLLLLGASALAVPVPAFCGYWEQASFKTDVRGLQMRLTEFANYLGGLPELDVSRLKKDLLAGLFFRSDIPGGYGLGSSGALCAAVYDRYCREKTSDPAQLKSIFAHMESFFHGASSGIDPLTSYVNKPLLIRNKTGVHVAEPAAWGTDRPIVFLLDTNFPRQTDALVPWFLEQSGKPDFIRMLEKDLIPAHEAALQAWLSADAGVFWTNLESVSRFQLEHFQPMVPGAIRPLWFDTFGKGDYIFKICGAGGGGFLLGFAKRLESVAPLLQTYRLIFPFDRFS